MSKDRDNDCTTQFTIKRKVAIIGASYAGLTLANYLKKNSIPFVIFESLPSYYNINDDDSNNDDGVISSTEVVTKLKPNLFVIGPFILPSFRRIANELGIQMNTCTTGTFGSKNGPRQDETQYIENCYERSDIILYLLRNVKEGIQFNTSIESITCIHNECMESSYYCNTIKTNGTYEKYGPVQYIIAADGVHSIVGSKYKFDDDRILLIGDARWVNDSWYNFGFQRVREGADVAMNDGLELGKILKSLIDKYDHSTEERQFDDNESKNNEKIASRIKKFSAYEKYKLRMRKGILRRFLFVVFVAYIIGKFLKGSQFMREVYV